MQSRRSAPAARQATLREHNLALVAQAIAESPGNRSRADIAALTGLTRATVSALVDRLIAARIVRELAPATPVRAGRPAVPLTLAARTLTGLGLEAGVDYLGGQIIDLTGAVVAERVEQRDPGQLRAAGPRAVLSDLGAIGRALLEDAERDGMQVASARLALPGLVDLDGTRLRTAPNLGWEDLHPLPLLGLGALQVHAVNEAKLAALAQTGPTSDGPDAGRPADAAATSYLYISGDIGIGSALIVDGGLFHGTHGWAGEIGHVVVDPLGPPCRCGARGCLEQFVGRNAVWRATGHEPGDPVEQLAHDAEHRDARTITALASAGTWLGSALADYMNLVDVQTVLLGGLFAPLLPYMRQTLNETLNQRVLAAPWSPVHVQAAPVTRYAAMNGGARIAVREVLTDPSPWTIPAHGER